MSTPLKTFQVYTRILDSTYRPVSYWKYEPQILAISSKEAIMDWVKLQERVYTVHDVSVDHWSSRPRREMYELVSYNFEPGLLVELNIREGEL